VRRATGGGSSSCGTRSWPSCALPGQEVQGPGPGPCLAHSLSLCLSASVGPKRNGRILASNLIKCREGVRRRAPFSFVRRAYGDQGLSVQTPRKAFQECQGSKGPQLPFPFPTRLAPGGQVSDPRCRWRNNPASHTGPSTRGQASEKPERRP
jgi:hypothetical protein